MSLPDAPNTLREKYYSVMAGQNDADILPDIDTAPSTENRYLDYIARNGGGGGGGDVTKAYVDEQDAKKTDKVTSAISGNFAGLDANGNLTDSGKTATDFATAADVSGEDISSTSTTSPLTDSADGFVQGVTVKGHSEVVDGAIKSIGDAGWGVVDLGTLTWEYASNRFQAQLSGSSVLSGGVDAICDNYTLYKGSLTGFSETDKSINVGNLQLTNIPYVLVRDTSYTDAATFKTAMSGVLLYYPLADTTGATPILGITSKNGAGQGTAATITTGLPLRSVSDSIYDTLDNEKVIKKCAEVDLGDLTWTYNAENTYFHSNSDEIDNCEYGEGCICDTYTNTADRPSNMNDMCISLWADNKRIFIKDSNYTDAATFKTAVTGVKLVYPLATPTETPLTSAEKTALASLRTYDHTTYIDATDAPTMTVDYLLNTNNGQAVAKVDKKTSQGIIYSLDEVKTNDVWIDGKPIYRRTIQFTAWNATVSASSWNIDTFFVDYSHSTFAAHTSNVAYTAPFVNNGSAQFDVWYDINNKKINMRTNGLSNNTLDAAYYTILYTKTTDTGNG